MDLTQFQLRCQSEHLALQLKVKKFNDVLEEQEQYGDGYKPKIKSLFCVCPNCKTKLMLEHIKTIYNKEFDKYCYLYILTCDECGYKYAKKTSKVHQN